jgi:hypothetical protein
VSQFGVEEGLGAGDFWVIEDSFASAEVTVMVFKPLPLPEGFQAALTTWLNGQNAVKKITLANREGDVILGIAHK